jgi:hypothetical protein
MPPIFAHYFMKWTIEIIESILTEERVAFALPEQAPNLTAVPPEAKSYYFYFKRQFLPFLLILSSKSSIFRV